jgi:hypothetical protein
MWEPMKPAPPLTTTFTRFSLVTRTGNVLAFVERTERLSRERPKIAD